MKLTEGRGVDHVLEVGGADTLGRSIASVAVGGRIALIGVLTGIGAGGSPYGLLRKQASMHGVFVGSRGHFERMNAAITANRARTDRRSRIRFRRGRRGLSSSRERRALRQSGDQHLSAELEQYADASLFAAARIRADHGIRQSRLDRTADVPRISRATSATCWACRNRWWWRWPMASPRPARDAALVNLHSAIGVGHALGSIFTAYQKPNAAGDHRRPAGALACCPSNPFSIPSRQRSLPKPYVKWSCEPARADDVPAAIARAYYTAMQPPRGPTFVSIPVDDWDRPVRSRWRHAPSAAAVAGDPALLARAAALLRRAPTRHRGRRVGGARRCLG